jgi:hypothetical protein
MTTTVFAETLGKHQLSFPPASAGFLLAFLFLTEDGSDKLSETKMFLLRCMIEISCGFLGLKLI